MHFVCFETVPNYFEQSKDFAFPLLLKGQGYIRDYKPAPIPLFYSSIPAQLWR